MEQENGSHVGKPSAGDPRTIDWPFWAFAAIATTLTAAAWLDFWVRTPGPALAFRVGPSEELVAGAQAMPGVAGELIAAPVRQRLPIHFSHGSLVRLDPAARARIVEVADRGSRILLESGMAHASIVHHADTRWSVQAGPFDVRVTGTQFDVAWDSAARALHHHPARRARRRLGVLHG